MSNVITITTRHARKFAAAVFTTALITGVLPAAAGAACPSSPTSNVIREVQRQRGIRPRAGWALRVRRPGLVADQRCGRRRKREPERRHALAIQPGGVAVSPAFCVSSEYPTFRFLVHQISGGGALNVSLRWTDAWGSSHNTLVSSLQAGTSWSLSPVLKLASVLPLWMPGSTLNVKLVFEPLRARCSNAAEAERGRSTASTSIRTAARTVDHRWRHAPMPPPPGWDARLKTPGAACRAAGHALAPSRPK